MSDLFYLQDSSITENEKTEWSKQYNSNSNYYKGWSEDGINLAKRVFVHNHRYDLQCK